MKKICTECNQLKDISEFTPSKRGKLGCRSKCGCKLSHDTPYGERGLIPKTNHPILDRINNETVLRLDNVEIICWKCNSTKLNRTKEEFYEYCRDVYMILKQNYEV
jgi:hypothetical protein